MFEPLRVDSVLPVSSSAQINTGLNIVPDTAYTTFAVKLNSNKESSFADKPKRKKTTRACIHCQKAHLTCDEGRPCKRCVKKGWIDTCRDGIRKKAKYLFDSQSEVENKSSIRPRASPNFRLRGVEPVDMDSKSGSVDSIQCDVQDSGHASLKLPPTPPEVSSLHSLLRNDEINPSFNGSDPSFSESNNFEFDLSNYDFGSKAANQEYSILSNILGANSESPTDLGFGSFSKDPIPESLIISEDTSISPDSVLDSIPNSLINEQPPVSKAMSTTSNMSMDSTVTTMSVVSNSSMSSTSSSIPETKETLIPFDTNPNTNRNQNLMTSEMNQINQMTSQLEAQTPQSSQIISAGPILPPRLSPGVTLQPHQLKRFRDPDAVYASVTQPFPYTKGYHALIAYLRSRFDREHLIHMAQAMAAYRPSFIATTKTLKEEDLIFMEKCFQRTLLEFEKIIFTSGTPTVVWRRTGQIAAVGKEFCILTGRTKAQLESGDTFIVELMDDKSVTKYFNVFSRLAFGDSRGVMMTECTLVKESGERIPTSCTWTVKRDVFDIPMMIVGNFLPILA